MFVLGSLQGLLFSLLLFKRVCSVRDGVRRRGKGQEGEGVLFSVFSPSLYFLCMTFKMHGALYVVGREGGKVEEGIVILAWEGK